ncbi:hypothetical protein Q0590_16985 [Rhodocytophaga aerolata]|uniref:Translocation/assembly module TamB n=1 Tax=Rhodocytophaga aerolata TaxID=455078 RepID=A0ABT8RB85_9BACT|nr:hypothetical protein [Rhodocytophaga aerolata]MDO1447970.1 hypothetical protein [Rhodocytophaga aerolata]
MKMKILLTLLLLSLLPQLLLAQYKLSDKPDEFLVDVSAMMAATKNADAIKAGKDLENIFTTRMSEGQRQKLIAISKKMSGKKYKAFAHFYPVYRMLNTATMVENISSGELDNLLMATEKSAEQYDSKQFLKVVETFNLFFSKKALYNSNYHRIYAQGGTYTIAFKDETAASQVPDTFKEIGEQPEEKQETNTNTSQPPANDGWSSWDNLETDTNAGADAPLPVQEMIFEKPIQPVPQGALLVFTNTNLVFATAYDSVQLTGTQGSLMLKKGVFVGAGGKFDWAIAGLPQAYCDMKEYNFDTRSTKLTAEGVQMTYPDVLTEPIEGIFEFISKKHKGPEDAQFPRFMSYYNKASLKNVGKNLVYLGGFSMVGKRTFSTALNNKPALLNYVENGETKFKTSGHKYEFGDSVIVAPRISVVIPHNRDSIYHPSVKLNYNKNIPLLRLNHTLDGFKSTPYVDTYHKVEITVDGVQWDLNSEELNFYTLTARSEVPAIFESYDFFDSTRYISLKGNYNFHPLQMLMAYSNSTKTQSFYVGDLAAKYKLNENIVRGAMIEMMQEGYVDYNAETGMVKMNRKGDHNVLANGKKRDYDSFRAESKSVSGPNATLNFGSNELVIKGIERFYLSNKLNVSVKPRNKEIKLLKDRNFLLDGEVAAGTYKFKGSGFFFLYDEFTVEMPQIDTILFTSQEALKKGNKKELGGEIRYGAGTLYINKPNNKAGLTDFPEYPRLNVESGATIYFDQRNRIAGSYNKNVRFEIPSVKLDSLNSKDPDYQGTFYSDGIFPPFKEALVPMPDNTLGFRHKPTQNAYNLYDSPSKIVFSGDIIMDMKGLRTSGTIEHLSTTLTSKDVLFTPDSVIAKGPTAEIKETTIGAGSFPQVKLKNYSLKWMPRADSMNISNTDTPFEIYKQTGATFKGMMVVRSTGLFGSGTLDRKDSETYSSAFQLDKTFFKASDAEFRIKSNVLTKPVLSANFVNVDFNMGQGLVTISTSTNPALSGFASLEFPYAAYKTSINKAKWDIAKKSIIMEGDVQTSTFTSMEPTQENLTFNARFALYNIEKYTLNIGGVPYIQSADARIMPKNGVVRIQENALMEPLVEAKLSIDTVYAYHNLFDGNVQILSRSKFVGNATYKYINSEKQEFNIKLGDFELKQEEATKKDKTPRSYTVAAGEVLEEDKFLIAPRILYKGNVTMLAPEKNLILDGSIKLDLKSQATLGAWLPYKNNKGEENIVINVDENLTVDNLPVTTGIHIDKQTSSIYTTFLSVKSNQDDKDLITAKGQLKYNPATNEFTVAPIEKLNNASMEGNQLVLNDATGKLKFSGKVDLFSAPSEYLLSSGIGEVDFASNDYSLNSLLAFNFPLPMQGVTTMGNTIVQTKLDKGVGDKEANDDKELLYEKLAAIIGNGATKSYKEKSKQGFIPLHQASKRLLATMVLSNVNLKWSEANKAFYSNGQLGVSNIANVDINSLLGGMVEIRKTPSGDDATIYLEITSDDWYYFDFTQNQLMVLSSDEKFNDVMGKKAKPGKPGQFSLAMATHDERATFIDRFNREYKGIATNTVKQQVSKTEEQPKPEQTLTQEAPVEQQVEAQPKPAKQKKEKTKKKKGKEEQPTLEVPQEEAPTEEKQPEKDTKFEKKDGF